VSVSVKGGPEGHHGVADVLVDDPLPGADDLDHEGEVAVEEAQRHIRGEAFAHAGEIGQVGEKHGHGVPLAALSRQAVFQQALDDTRIDVFAEGLADALLLPQAGHHVVEGFS